jgi:hypothetical protein
MTTEVSPDTETIRYVPVYWLHTPSFSPPDFHLPRLAALQLIRDEETEPGTGAKPINRGKAIRLQYDRPCKLRDVSCHPTLNTMLAMVYGSDRARAILNGWRPVFTVGPINPETGEAQSLIRPSRPSDFDFQPAFTQ